MSLDASISLSLYLSISLFYYVGFYVRAKEIPLKINKLREPIEFFQVWPPNTTQPTRQNGRGGHECRAGTLPCRRRCSSASTGLKARTKAINLSSPAFGYTESISLSGWVGGEVLLGPA